jgi:tetratricopeptide (TPR) repeat protein
MPKPTRRDASPSAPTSEQLAAVRRAADVDDLPRARQRLAALRKAFPGFKPLLGLAWEVEDRCGSPMIATARAHAWHRAAPNSRAALEALYESAREAGVLAVFTRAAQRLRALDGQSPLPSIDSIDTPLGPLSLEQAEAIDLSRMHLADDNQAAAAAVLQGVDHPSARNNLALALFGSGDLAQALAVIDANWQADAANLFALERLLRWRCWAEGLDRCLGFAPTLRQAVPRRAEDAFARVAALRFLGDEEGVRQAWDDTTDAPYWGGAPDQRELFEALREHPDELPGNNALWFPAVWMRAISGLSRESKRGGEQHAQARWEAQLDACDAHVDYLRRAAELGDATVRLLALAVLKRRAQLGGGAALVALQALLKRPCGPNSVRMDLLNWLAEQGFHDRKEPVDIWLSGSLRTIRSHSQNITNETRPSPFPAQGTALNERVHKAIASGKLNEALALAQQLRQMHPEQPSALINLAAVKEGLGHPAAQITDLYRQALALAPDYLFARCGLSRYLAGEGKVEEARALLDGLVEREEWHRSEYRTFLLSQRALALATGEHEAARALAESVRELEQDFAQ